MPRPSLIRSKTHSYHVTSRTLDQKFFPLPLKEVWYLMLKDLNETQKKHQLAIHAFILMGNHFHLLCHTPRGNLAEAMQFFLRSTSLRILRMSEKAGPLWAHRYKWSLINSQRHYYQVYRYLFQNPLRAGICNKVEEYPFSSLHEVPFPLHSHVPMGFGGHEGELHWLNEPYDKEDETLIKLGLRKYQFDVSQRKIKAFNKLTLPNK